jgi:lipoyl(octanoyl) transferase
MPTLESPWEWMRNPHCYTAGTSAEDKDLITKNKIPIYTTGRGGQYTYHGPGQRIGYAMVDLQKRGIDIRDYVCRLEKWMIAALADCGIKSETREGRIGIWVATPKGEKKIGALGVRVRRGVAFHGISLNVNPDLSYFNGIVPCGLREYGVTSIADLGGAADIAVLDQALQRHFPAIFAPTACR